MVVLLSSCLSFVLVVVCHSCRLLIFERGRSSHNLSFFLVVALLVMFVHFVSFLTFVLLCRPLWFMCVYSHIHMHISISI